MANTRISNLTASASNLASADLAPVVQTAGVGPVKMTGLQLAGGLLGSTTFNGSTVTTSSPVLNLTQTWNDGAVTFTGLKFNATDTASASGSLLLDLQVGGTSQFNLSKAGLGVFKGKVASSFGYSYGNPQFYDASIGTGVGFQIKDSAEAVIYAGGSAILAASSNATGVRLQSTSPLCWSSTSHALNAPDTFLTRATTATLQLGAADAAAPVAQTFKVQGVVAGTTNTAGANFTIQGSQGTGTGAGGSIIFQVAPAGSSGTAQNAYSTALTIDSTRTATFAAGATFAAAVQGATNIGATNNLFAGAAFNNAAVLIGSAYGGIASVSTGFVSWTSSTTDPSGTRDLILARDAANTLALRNGGTSGTPVPQTFNIYNYYASSTDFERCALKWSSNTFTIGLESNGGFTSREFIIVSGSGQPIRFYAGATQRWLIDQSGNLITGAASYDIGSPTSNRPGNIYAATSIRATGSTAVIGYGTGAGGAVTQATSRTTGVTLNKGCGQITLVSAAGTTSWQSFTVSNTTVAATDTIIVNQDSGTDLYQIFVTNVAANSFQITFATTGGTTTEQPVFSFAVIKAVAA